MLTRQLDIAWALFEYHLQGLDDALCLWEPEPYCWTVRPDGKGHWTADWEVPEPDPEPAVSIGWVTWHIGYWWTTTLGHCFKGGAPEREEITWPGGADAAAGGCAGCTGNGGPAWPGSPTPTSTPPTGPPDCPGRRS